MMASNFNLEIRIVKKDLEQLPVVMGFHLGLTLNPFLFVLMMNELTQHIQEMSHIYTIFK